MHIVTDMMSYFILDVSLCYCYFKEWHYYRFPNNLAEISDLFVVTGNKISKVYGHTIKNVRSTVNLLISRKTQRMVFECS